MSRSARCWIERSSGWVGRRSTPSPTKAHSSGGVLDRADPCEEALYRPLAAFLGLAPSAPDKDREERLADWVLRALPLPDAVAVERAVLMAVADPLDTPHAQHFDRSVNYFGLAVADSGWLRDRGWLPWLDEQEPTRRCRDRVPGILIYRRARPGRFQTETTERLLAFVVGESPTRGVHIQAFRSAVELAFAVQSQQTIADVAPPPSSAASRQSVMETEPVESEAALSTAETHEWDHGRPRPVVVVGPTFSGSASSMRRALLTHGSPRRLPRHIDFISGSATSLQITDDLNTPLWTGARSVSLHLRRTIATDDVLQGRLYQYLHELGASPEQVALLHEAGTAYGQQHFEEERNAPAHVLSIPPNVSSIRAAYASARTGLPYRSPLRALLPPMQLAPETGAPVTDWEPLRPLAPNTPVCNDRAISELMFRVGGLGARYVGVRATDPEDVIFLAEQIRKSSADVRLFTFGLDLRYAHPKNARNLDGMLVATSYPALGGYECGRVFASDYDVGLYNAVLLAAGETQRRCQYPADRDGRGPAAVVVIRNRHAWPLHTAGSPSADEPPELQRKPPSSLLLLLFAIAVLGGVSVHEYIRFRGHYQERVAVSPFRVFAAAPKGHGRREQAKFIVLFFLLLTCLFAVMAPFVWPTFPSDGTLAQVSTEALGDLANGRLDAIVSKLLRLGTVTCWFLVGAGAVALEQRCGQHVRRAFQVVLIGSILGAVVGSALAATHAAGWSLHNLVGALFWSAALATAALGLRGDCSSEARQLRLGLIGAFGALGALLWTAGVRDALHATVAVLFWAGAGAVAATLSAALRSYWDAKLGRKCAVPPDAQPDTMGTAPSAPCEPLTGRLAQGVTVTALATPPLMTVCFLAFYWPSSTPHLTLQRSLQIGSGVSPLAPFVIAVAFYFWFVLAQLARLRMASRILTGEVRRDSTRQGGVLTRLLTSRHGESAPPGSASPHPGTGIAELKSGLLDILGPWFTSVWRLPIIDLFVGISLGIVLIDGLAPFESRHGTLLLVGALVAVWVGTIDTAARLYLFVGRLTKLLRRLAVHPVAQALSHLPKRLTATVESQLTGRAPRALAHAESVRLFRYLTAQRGEANLPDLPGGTSTLMQVENTYARELQRALGPRPDPDGTCEPEDVAATADQLTQIAGQLAEGLRPYWQPTGQPCLDPAPDMTSGTVRGMVVWKARLSPSEYRPLCTAESLVACQVALYLRRLLRQCAPLFVALTLGGLAALAMVVAYDYQPRRLLMTALSLQVIAIVALQVYAFMRLNRDEVLPRIAGTPPGALKLSRSLLVRGLTWVVLPLLVVVVVHNPGITMAVVDWLEPITVLLQ